MEIMRELLDYVERLQPLSQPVDDLEECTEYRLASGRQTGKEEVEAMQKLLSKIKFTYDVDVVLSDASTI